MANNPKIFDPTFVKPFTLSRFTGASLKSAIDFTQQSPWGLRTQPGLPPAYVPAPPITSEGGQPQINGVPLAPLNISAQESGNTPLPAPAAIATTISDPMKYGDMSVIIVAFAAAGDILVLPRPSGKRTLLIVENDLAAPNTIRMNFDKIADANSGLRIISGGNAFFDAAVPQNDIHIFAPVAGNVIVTYINVAIPTGAQ